ncbi:uncharacterized protein [Montipora foliosa]|uniref:uncharacterized protein n=1 Tax=Montipora foliosa TaxID=591990 RepID=UPI0035F1B9F2
MSNKNYLTVDEFRKMWKNELLPSIRREVKLEIETLSANIQVLTDRCNQIEQSIQFLSDKYDTVLGILQATKKQIAGLEVNVKEQADQISKLQEADYGKDCRHCTIDVMQQYLQPSQNIFREQVIRKAETADLRRDCIEITGIPVLPLDNPKQLVLELGSLIGVSISEDQISTAHRLPDTKKVKNRIIAKFVQRDKREEFYKKKKNLIGKKSIASLLPSVQDEMGKSVFSDNKIHINESLTAYRKRLFGRINSLKQQYNHKFLWTANGKILLRETETSRILSFSTHEEFEDYLDEIIKR